MCHTHTHHTFIHIFIIVYIYRLLISRVYLLKSRGARSRSVGRCEYWEQQQIIFQLDFERRRIVLCFQRCYVKNNLRECILIVSVRDNKLTKNVKKWWVRFVAASFFFYFVHTKVNPSINRYTHIKHALINSISFQFFFFLLLFINLNQIVYFVGRKKCR